ncbi:hypothetical protein GGI35DRAFT_452409 [Trichoderma velutinum]
MSKLSVYAVLLRSGTITSNQTQVYSIVNVSELRIYSKDGAPIDFRLHLRAPQLIGPAPATLFNGSELGDGRAVAALAVVLAVATAANKFKSLLDANWLSASARQYMDALGQSCFTSRSDGDQFPSNLQQRASDARHDPRWASHIRCRGLGTVLANSSINPCAIPVTDLALGPLETRFDPLTSCFLSGSLMNTCTLAPAGAVPSSYFAINAKRWLLFEASHVHALY